MAPALPPALAGRPALDMFVLLAQFLHEAGVHIEYGHIDDDAHWHAATHTLTLRADATQDDHTHAVGEFYRYIKLDPEFSRFTDQTPVRHLYAVP